MYFIVNNATVNSLRNDRMPSMATNGKVLRILLALVLLKNHQSEFQHWWWL